MNSHLLPRTINASHMLQVNRSAILELIRLNSPIARSEIHQLLKLSSPTVIRIVDDLIQDGLVCSTGEKAGVSGRPRELLEYNKRGASVIGIDLGGTKLYGALANIGGEILGEISKSQHATSGNESYALVAEMISVLINKSRGLDQKLLGIAVGAPGVTNTQTGCVQWAPSLGWREFPLKQKIADMFHLPVVVDNDVNLAVLGEQWFGVGKGVKNLLLLSIGTGMGAGIVIDGMIHRGHHEAAGEVGYIVPEVGALGRQYDKFGAMENLVSGTGIAERAKEALRNAWSQEDLSKLTAEDVFAAARREEEWAVHIIDETADYLSLVIANISSILDPELVILSGGVSNSIDVLIPRIQERLNGVVQYIPRLQISTLGARATVMGAISLILYLTKDFYVIRHL